jgi:Flp pilus assembly protein TadB
MNAILFAPALTSGFPCCFASLAVTTLVQYLIFGGAILLVAGGVMLWAVRFRRKPRTRRYHYRRSQPADRTAAAPVKKERRRRSEPPRNPTLAETRGLPPVRDEQSASTGNYQH